MIGSLLTELPMRQREATAARQVVCGLIQSTGSVGMYLRFEKFSLIILWYKEHAEFVMGGEKKLLEGHI